MPRYTLVLLPEPDGSAWNVVLPSLPGVFTWGATVPEAVERAREAIAVHLEGEDEIPDEGEAVVVAIDVPVAAAVLG